MHTPRQSKYQDFNFMRETLERADTVATAIINAFNKMPHNKPDERKSIAANFRAATLQALQHPDHVSSVGASYHSPSTHRLFKAVAQVVTAQPYLEAAAFDATARALLDSSQKLAYIPSAIALLRARRENNLPPLPTAFFSHLPAPLDLTMLQLKKQTGVALQTFALDVGKLFIELDQQPHLTNQLSKPLYQWYNIVAQDGLYGLIPTITEHLNPERHLYQHLAGYVAESGHRLDKPDLLTGHTSHGLPVFYDASNGAGGSPADWLRTKVKQAKTLCLKKELVDLHAPFALAYLTREIKTASPSEPRQALKAAFIEAEISAVFNAAAASGELNAKRRRRLVWAAHTGIDPNAEKDNAVPPAAHALQRAKGQTAKLD